jgi:hypothetical protein
MDEAMKSKNFNLVWEIVDKVFKNKPLPKGRKTKIEKIVGTYYAIVEEPYLMD